MSLCGLVACNNTEAVSQAKAKHTSAVQLDYMVNCQGCHLPNGEGFVAKGVPALDRHMGMFLHVEGGREFLVRVPGAALSDLSDEHLARVTNWMLNQFSPAEIPANFKPYTASEVGRLRARPFNNVSEVRTVLLARIDAVKTRKTSDELAGEQLP